MAIPVQEKLISLFNCSPFGPPESSGVYMIVEFSRFNNDTEIVYVGSSKNILKRVMNPNHPYRQQPKQGLKRRCLTYECENFKELEVELIGGLNPRINKNHRSCH